MELTHVVALATDDGRLDVPESTVASTCREMIKRAAGSLTPPDGAGDERDEGTAALYLLALMPGTASQPLQERKPRAAAALHIQPGTLDQTRPGRMTYRERVIEAVADALVAQQTSYRLEQAARAQQERRSAAQSALGIDWIARFEDYYRVWDPVVSLKDRLQAALAAARGKHEKPRHRLSPPQPYAEYLALCALYDFVSYLAGVDEFIKQRGGLWILPHAIAEQAVADSAFVVADAAPFNLIQQSELLAAHRAVPDRHALIERLEGDSDLRPFATGWSDWLASCSCELSNPQPQQCSVHEVIAAAGTICKTLDQQWDELADWYEVRRPRVSEVDRLRRRQMPGQYI